MVCTPVISALGRLTRVYYEFKNKLELHSMTISRNGRKGKVVGEEEEREEEKRNAEEGREDNREKGTKKRGRGG